MQAAFRTHLSRRYQRSRCHRSRRGDLYRPSVRRPLRKSVLLFTAAFRRVPARAWLSGQSRLPVRSTGVHGQPEVEARKPFVGLNSAELGPVDGCREIPIHPTIGSIRDPIVHDQHSAPWSMCLRQLVHDQTDVARPGISSAPSQFLKNRGIASLRPLHRPRPHLQRLCKMQRCGLALHLDSQPIAQGINLHFARGRLQRPAVVIDFAAV